MADVFQEVDEELRQEQQRALFRRYAPYGAALLAAIVIGVGGREYMSARAERQAQDGARAYFAAVELMEADSHPAARAAFAALSDTGHGGYPAIAKMHEATAALAEGDDDEAAALFEAAASLSPDAALADLSRLRALYIRADGMSLEEVLAGARPLVEPGRPFALPARELMAAAALKHGAYDLARTDYRLLVGAPEATPGMQRRANAALAVIATLSSQEESDDS